MPLQLFHPVKFSLIKVNHSLRGIFEVNLKEIFDSIVSSKIWPKTASKISEMKKKSTLLGGAHKLRLQDEVGR